MGNIKLLHKTQTYFLPGNCSYQIIVANITFQFHGWPQIWTSWGYIP